MIDVVCLEVKEIRHHFDVQVFMAVLEVVEHGHNGTFWIIRLQWNETDVLQGHIPLKLVTPCSQILNRFLQF